MINDEEMCLDDDSLPRLNLLYEQLDLLFFLELRSCSMFGVGLFHIDAITREEVLLKFKRKVKGLWALYGFCVAPSSLTEVELHAACACNYK